MVQATAAASATPARVRARKREILLAASRRFRRQGLHATGMRDIAAELGMAVGNLYYYFRDKEELIAFCQQDALSGLLALAEAVRRLPLPADQRLYLLIVGHSICLHEHTPGALAHLEIEAITGARREALVGLRDRYEGHFRALLGEGQAAGLLRPLDARVTARAMLGALNWTVKWYRPEGDTTPRALGSELAELLLRGTLAPGVELIAPDLAVLPDLGPQEEAT
jgi:TetR/AcrR family transcriptional regulator, cholesterol catabolism regulator